MSEAQEDERPGAESEAVETAGPTQAAATSGDQAERPLTDEERAALLRESLKALRVVDVAHDMMLSLVTLGYQKLGLTDETRELRNLDDARLAIELLRGALEAVAAVAGEQLVAPFRSTLAAMQMNFARVAAEPAPAEAPAPAQDGAAEHAPEASHEADRTTGAGPEDGRETPSGVGGSEAEGEAPPKAGGPRQSRPRKPKET